MAITTTNPETRTNIKSGYFPPFKVLIHNDDVTPMDFVVAILKGFFSKSTEKAYAIMEEAHHKKVALVGVYPKEQAEFLIEQVHSMAKTHKMPLKLSLESDD